MFNWTKQIEILQFHVGKWAAQTNLSYASDIYILWINPLILSTAFLIMFSLLLHTLKLNYQLQKLI